MPPPSRHQDFSERPLRSEDLLPQPLDQFGAWLAEAIAAGEADPFAMVMSTRSLDGAPSSRVVALKEVRTAGFVFTCPTVGPKADELRASPLASLVFYWPKLGRQVRAIGVVEPLPQDESRRFFDARPRAARLALHVAAPGEPIASRDVLEARLAALETAYEDQSVPMPDWGAFMLVPSAVELWQGQTNRLHDRFRYARGGRGDWQISRLAP